MSWFDSKKLQTYAKSTLLQAQKQIDKVLDIKEEEILNNQNNNVPVPVITNELPQDSDTITDNFFTSFLNQEPQKLEPAVKKSSTTLGSSNFNFEDFLNQDSKKLQVSKQKTKQTTHTHFEKNRYTDLPNFSEFQILRYENTLFQRCSHIFLYLLNIFVINTGSEGPDLVDFLEAPGITH